MSKKFHSDISFPDDNKIKLGTGEDAEIYVNNDELIIQNTTSDKDIVFNINDGGSTVEAIRIDAENSRIGFFNSSPSKIVSITGTFQTSGESFFNNFDVTNGSSASRFRDGHVVHFNTNRTANIFTSSNDLYITNGEDDKDMLFRCDDGAGGVETYFRLDGSAATHDGSANTAKYTVWGDNSIISLGDGNDLQLLHDTSNSHVVNYTGDLKITNNADDKDIIFNCDDGSGGNTAYITLDGSTTEILLAQTTKAQGTNLTVEPSSGGNGQLNVTRTSGATTFIQSQSAAGIIGTSSNHKLNIKTNDSTRLSIATSGDATFNHNITVTGNITANGNIVGDDSTAITNISSIGADTYAADADSTTRFDLSSDEILCLIQDEDCFSSTTSATTFHTKLIAKNRVLAKTTNSDANFDGDIVYFGGTTSMDAGKIYYLNSSGNWALADADAESTAKGMLGVALGAASDTNGVLIRGMVTLDHDPGTIGDTVFLSTTAGQASSTAPSGNGDIVRVVGYCLDSTNGQVYFNPDGTFVEVTA